MSPAVRSWIAFFHRWIGLPAGIGLFIIFSTGSLAAFSIEIQQWMQPQSALSSVETEEGLLNAGRLLSDAQRAHKMAFLMTPSARDSAFRLWEYDGHIFRGEVLHPSTGNILQTRNVVGGSFFVTLHDCFYMPNIWGRTLVLISGIGMIIALITGTILQYRRFFSDLILFRPHASPHRWWLDSHLLFGTLSLPIFMVVALSGVIIQLQTLTTSASKHHSAPHTPAPTPPPLSPSTLLTLEKQGKHIWKDTAGGFFMPLGGETYLYRPDQSTFCITRAHISTTNPTPEASPSCPSLRSILTGVHNMRWAGLTMRWLYFFIGIAGSIVMASGLILFYKTEKRKSQNTPLSSLSLHLIYSLNTTTIIGFPLACLSLLWSVRLPEWPSTPSLTWQTNIFFAVWAASLIHALCFRRSARLQLLLLMITGLGLLPIDLLTRSFMSPRPFLFISVDAVALMIGLTGLIAYRKMRPA